MQMYDIVMVGVLVGATAFGAIKGMAWQLASLASFVLSYFVSLRYSEQLAPMFGEESPWNRFVAMAVLYLGCSLLIWLAFRVVADFIDRVRLKEFDHQIGALFGVAKGVLLCVVLTFFALTLSTGLRESVLQSRSGYYIARLIDEADAVMPREVHAVLDPYLHKLEQELEPATGETSVDHETAGRVSSSQHR